MDAQSKTLTDRAPTTTTALMTSSHDLPMDIVTNILAKLPSKSLLRFRCVCKSWRGLISDPKFIQLHRNQNGNGHVLVQSVPKNSPTYRDFRCSLLCEKTFVTQTRLERPLEDFRVLGHSNGLVCLSVGFYVDLYLWNPSIRKMKLLPKPIYPFDEPKFGAIHVFGFVPKLNDYRVLKIYGEIGEKFEIYSLSTNCWKVMDNVVPSQLIEHYFRIINVVNGVVYLRAADKTEDDGYQEIILTFDMADEVFGKINIPQFSRIYVRDEFSDPFVCLGSLGCCSSLICFYNQYDLDIWTKTKEEDAAQSWTKTLTNKQDLAPIGFLKNGELVLKYANLHRMTSYDPRLLNPELKDLQFDTAPWTVWSFNYYLESLVLLNEGN